LRPQNLHVSRRSDQAAVATVCRIEKSMTERKDDARGEVVLYQASDGTVSLDVRLERQSLWLSLSQMAALFDRDKSLVSRHLRNIFCDAELDREADVAENATTAKTST
jgi:hypothetical protein